jgi:hypothetical protein
MLFISLFVALCVKLNPRTHKAFSFCLKTGCENKTVVRLPGAMEKWVTTLGWCGKEKHDGERKAG